MTEKANEFYENKWLVAHFGLAPWKQYVAYARMNMVLAEKFYQVLILLTIYIIIWKRLKKHFRDRSFGQFQSKPFL